MADKTIVFNAENITEIQALLRSHPKIVPIAGCTSFITGSFSQNLSLPEQVLKLNGVHNLSEITKTERYIEFGGTSTLESILACGRRNMPAVLYDAIAQIGTFGSRTLGTIGGNVAGARYASATFAVLMALEAKLEIITAESIDWMPFARYADEGSLELRAQPHVIARVRVDTSDWQESFYYRIGERSFFDKDAMSFVCLIRCQKDLISELRLIYTCAEVVREKEFENILLGRSLPMPLKDIAFIMEKARKIYDRSRFASDYMREAFFHLLESCLYNLI